MAISVVFGFKFRNLRKRPTALLVPIKRCNSLFSKGCGLEIWIVLKVKDTDLVQINFENIDDAMKITLLWKKCLHSFSARVLITKIGLPDQEETPIKSEITWR